MKRRPHSIKIPNFNFSRVIAWLAIGMMPVCGASAENQIESSYGKLPLQFEKNTGHFDRSVHFLVQGPGYTVSLNGNGATLQLHSGSGRTDATRQSVSRMQMKLLGANPAPEAAAIDPLPGKINYLVGNEPEKWPRNGQQRCSSKLFRIRSSAWQTCRLWLPWAGSMTCR